MKQTLQQKINSKSNDYSKIESEFKTKTGLNLVTTDKQDELSIDCNESISLIISCYEGNRTLPLVLKRLENQSYKKFEAVIVDDGSLTDISTLIGEAKSSYRIKFVKQLTNKGRSYTRNTGIIVSEGSSIIFTDQDIIFDSDFILRFAIRQYYTSQCVFIGFKEDIALEDLTDSRKANINSDWRYSVKGERSFIPLYSGKKLPTNPGRIYRILEETNNLKRLGFGRNIGFWSLPSMVISHGICVKRKFALSSGGFPEEGFYGWGAQDIAFGARLIGEGNFVVPLLNNVYFHITHKRYSGSREKELEELKINLRSYFDLLRSVKYNSQPRKRKIKKTKKSGNIEFFEID